MAAAAREAALRAVVGDDGGGGGGSGGEAAAAAAERALTSGVLLHDCQTNRYFHSAFRIAFCRSTRPLIKIYLNIDLDIQSDLDLYRLSSH